MGDFENKNPRKSLEFLKTFYAVGDKTMNWVWNMIYRLKGAGLEVGGKSMYIEGWLE